jgi:hypothetical protein
MPEGLDPHNKLASQISRNPSIRPGGSGGWEKAWAFEPGILEAKSVSFRGGGWDIED